MKVQVFKRVLAAICITATGCVNQEPVTTSVPAPPRSMMYILADITTSVDTSTKKNVAENYKDVVESMSPNTAFEVYEIGKEAGPPLFSGKIGDETTLSDDKAMYEKMANKILERPAQDCTCIASSIQRLYPMIRHAQSSTEYKKVYLVILSDMLEACPLNGSMVNLESRDNFGKAMRILDAWKGENYVWDSLKTNIVVVHTSGKLTDIDNLGQFWDKYFEKVHFPSKVDFIPHISRDFFK